MKNTIHTSVSPRKILARQIANYVRNYPGRQVEGQVFIEAQIESKFGVPLKSLPEEFIEQAITLVQEYLQKINKLREFTRTQILQTPKYI